MNLDQRLIAAGFRLEKGILSGERLTMNWMRGPDAEGICKIDLPQSGPILVQHVQRIDLRNITLADHHIQRLIHLRPLVEPPTLYREILDGVLSAQGPEVRGCIPGATLEIDEDGIVTITVPKGGTIVLRGFSRIVLDEPERSRISHATPTHS